MKLGSNRRLANIKTRKETGLDYITQNLELGTPFGRKELSNITPFFPGEEEELREELNHVDDMLSFVKSAPSLYDAIEMVFMEMKDPSLTVERSEDNILNKNAKHFLPVKDNELPFSDYLKDKIKTQKHN